MPSVKYSTLWPSRRVSPAAAMRAMPTSFGPDSKSGSSGRGGGGVCIYSPFVRYRLNRGNHGVNTQENLNRAHLRMLSWSSRLSLICDSPDFDGHSQTTF